MSYLKTVSIWGAIGVAMLGLLVAWAQLATYLELQGDMVPVATLAICPGAIMLMALKGPTTFLDYTATLLVGAAMNAVFYAGIGTIVWFCVKGWAIARRSFAPQNQAD